MYDPPPHHPGHFVHVSHPFPRHPAAWCPRQRKRFQDGRELREVKASKAFIWPKDGRNNTSWGRFKDILHNKGPDIFLTINADERDAMRNRPSKAQLLSIRRSTPLGFTVADWVAAYQDWSTTSALVTMVCRIGHRGGTRNGNQVLSRTSAICIQRLMPTSTVAGSKILITCRGLGDRWITSEEEGTRGLT
jgi:hypothetical protein